MYYLFILSLTASGEESQGSHEEPCSWSITSIKQFWMDVRRLAHVAAVRRTNVNVLWLKHDSTALFNSGSSGVLKMACKTEFNQQRLDPPFMPLFNIFGTCNTAPELFGSYGIITKEIYCMWTHHFYCCTFVWWTRSSLSTVCITKPKWQTCGQETYSSFVISSWSIYVAGCAGKLLR